ncbi:hypothetical protein V8C35DRAFT_314448 [Trichoderma chlorosporum]
MAFCSPCNREFKDEAGLEMHLRDSKLHQKPVTEMSASPGDFVCTECVGEHGKRQGYGTKKALKNHIWRNHRRGTKTKKKDDAAAKDAEETLAAVRKTPLDEFFASFAGFAYNPRLSPEASWKALRRFKRWKNGPGTRTVEENDAWAEYQSSLMREVNLWYGDVEDLTAWRTLCKAVGVIDPPHEIPTCRKILRNTHVNIVDLIHWGRESDMGDGEKVKIFRTVEELRAYTLITRKIFAKEELEEHNEGNVVLKHLLRVIFTKEAFAIVRGQSRY